MSRDEIAVDLVVIGIRDLDTAVSRLRGNAAISHYSVVQDVIVVGVIQVDAISAVEPDVVVLQKVGARFKIDAVVPVELDDVAQQYVTAAAPRQLHAILHVVRDQISTHFGALTIVELDAGFATTDAIAV